MKTPGDTKKDEGYNGKFWKAGGSFYRDCITWTIARIHLNDPASPGPDLPGLDEPESCHTFVDPGCS
jgi:hypothetical protein